MDDEIHVAGEGVKRDRPHHIAVGGAGVDGHMRFRAEDGAAFLCDVVQDGGLVAIKDLGASVNQPFVVYVEDARALG